ncbi:hypothetical protein MBLNU457_7032t1 [Dothideomycetes sp. NU457]
MAAAIKALNARIRANPYTDYLFSTRDALDFLGPASNFGIPLAAIADTQKDPEIISGPMTAALVGYSGVFMRYSFAVTPVNYLLFGCHAINFTCQSIQSYRYLTYWKFGGREKSLEQKAKVEANSALDSAESEINAVSEKAKDLGAQAQNAVKKVTG